MKNLIVFGALVMFASNMPGQTVDSAVGSNDQQAADDIIAIAEDSASRKVDPFIEEEDSNGLSNDLTGPLSNDDIEDQATIATNDSFEEQPLDAGSNEPAIDGGVVAPPTDGGVAPPIEQRRRLTTALENFSPSEEISADNAVPFPVDI